MCRAALRAFALLCSAVFAAAPDRLPAAVLEKAASSPAFSFVYDGKASGDVISSWKRTTRRSTLPGGRVRVETTYLDPSTKLEVTREITRFPKHPAIEVMLRLRNKSRSGSPLIENIRAVDLAFDAPGAGPVVFHHALGSAARVSQGDSGMSRDFEPIDTVLDAGETSQIVHYILQGRRHVESYLPFFSLEWRGGGVVGGIGWTGQWWVRAGRGSGRGVILQAGQEKTRLRLLPGESIRTPRVLLVEWRGTDRVAGHNRWRRVLVDHYLPRVAGEVPFPPVAHTAAYNLIFRDVAGKTGKNPLEVLPTLKPRDLGTRFAGTTASLNWVTPERSLQVIRGVPAVGLETYWWDAGWFEGDWPHRGTWIPRREFPPSLKPVGDAAHQRQMGFLLWYDPEGVSPGSLIARRHPEWVLHQPEEGRWGGIYKWSEPAALQHMTDLVAGQIRDWGIDIYRNDRNTCPLPFWEVNDAPDRQGITEIRQIEGFYAFLDGLLQRSPKLTIDNANWRVTGPDLEMMMRSLGSLTRTELAGPGVPYPVPEQAMTAELSLWVPLHATLLHSMDTYSFRSTATTGVAIGLDLQSRYIPVEVMRKGIAEVKELRPFWLGDYYPLTPISRDEQAWCAWQFDRQDLGGGFAMFFRRSHAPETLASGLRGLGAKTKYDVSFAETYDVRQRRVMSGAELARLRVGIGVAPGSMLIRYQKRREP